MNENAAVLQIPPGPLEDLLRKEWLVTNGLGGYASGTVAGIPTRRYHGLLIPNLPSPRGRTVLLPHLEETAVVDNQKFILSGREEKENRFVPGSLYVKEFRLEWMMPVWEFAAGNSRIQKRLLMPENQDTIYVDYLLLDGPPALLELRPYFTSRGHDDHFHEDDYPYSVVIKQNRFELHPKEGGFEVKAQVMPGGIFTAQETRNDFFFRVEKNRGMDDHARFWSPGYFTVRLERDRPAGFLASTEPWETLPPDFNRIVENEKKRLRTLLDRAPAASKPGSLGDFQTRLALSADEFIVLPGSRVAENRMIEASGEHVRTIMAGYHWFTDWGRDTMISLEGLCLCTGRHDEAKAILRTFANYIHDGLIPNHFPEGHNLAIYNTADASLWYFHAIDRYFHHTGDEETLSLIFPLLKSMIEKHEHGTAYGIGRDHDGLLRAWAENFALSWMDAKAGDWVVTPRRGKPVEIQALWYNALRLMADWSEKYEPSIKEHYAGLAKTAYDSFNARFWFAEGNYLYDVVDGENGNDTRFRPNQIFSLSLRYPVLKEERAKIILDAVHSKLMTPYGLRTLDPGEKDFLPLYQGSRVERDGAYHQGLVWPWLTGHFYNAWRHVHGDTRVFANFFQTMEKHFSDAGVGNISEIFDAHEPHAPRGCIAQAWSVAELLRMLWLENRPEE